MAGAGNDGTRADAAGADGVVSGVGIAEQIADALAPTSGVPGPSAATAAAMETAMAAGPASPSDGGMDDGPPSRATRGTNTDPASRANSGTDAGTTGRSTRGTDAATTSRQTRGTGAGTTSRQTRGTGAGTTSSATRGADAGPATAATRGTDDGPTGGDETDTDPPAGSRGRTSGKARPTSRRTRTAPAARQPLAATLRRVERSAGALASASVTRMDETLPWFRALPADQRSWVMLVAQAGVQSLVEWLRSDGTVAGSTQEISDEVFAAAPRALARSITLTQTVQLIKVTIDVAESQVTTLAAAGEEAALAEAILRFSREIAFSAARVYARAAESRGAWDSRLQALLVDALLRGDSTDVLASRAAALGWVDAPPVSVVVGRSPGGDITAVLHSVYRAGRRARIELIGGVHGDRLVVVMGGVPDPVAAAGQLAASFGAGPVVVGPAVPTLDQANESARAALAGYRAAGAWPGAPTPVAADDLLPERALAGDGEARRALRHDAYGAVVRAGGGLLETLDAFFAAGGVLESAARELYVHPNTVRYRLKRVAEVTGLSPLDGRDAFALRLALIIGRLDPTP